MKKTESKSRILARILFYLVLFAILGAAFIVTFSFASRDNNYVSRSTNIVQVQPEMDGNTYIGKWKIMSVTTAGWLEFQYSGVEIPTQENIVSMMVLPVNKSNTNLYADLQRCHIK